jgi:hypothetical protein
MFTRLHWQSASPRSTLLICALFYANTVLAAAPNDQQIVQLMGFSTDEINQLNSGQPVANRLEANADNELALNTSIYIAQPISKVVNALDAADIKSIDPNVQHSSDLPKNAGLHALQNFSLGPSEIELILDGDLADHYNLSADEQQTLQALSNTLSNSDADTQSNQINQQYRNFLLARLQSYSQNGLQGIAPYRRDDGSVANPGNELRRDATSGVLLQQFYPQLYDAWLNYPNNLTASVRQEFSWQNRIVENRATAILAHRMTYQDNSAYIILARQFYVGHSYNSSSLAVGILPYQNGTLVFYRQRTSTDQITGLASGLRHDIGRSQMQDQMFQRLKRLSALSNASS